MSIFREYAWGYDLLYRDKPYAAEAAFVHELIRELFPARSPEQLTILDLACGTARHGLEWTKRGYVVEGSEPSEDMRRIAQGNIEKASARLAVHPYSFQECARIGQTYDVVSSMFGSLGYLVDHDELKAGFANIASLLASGGFLIFDYWNGLAVPSQYSPVKVLDVSDGPRSIHRVSRTTLDPNAGTAEVVFDLMLIEEGRMTSRTSERHVVRYFTPLEIRLLLESAGLELVKSVPFMNAARPPAPNDWNVTAVARKK